jgi:hypothetical protein
MRLLRAGRVRGAAAATFAACAVLALGACGEKEEPDLSTVPVTTETETTQTTSVPTTTGPAPQGATGTGTNAAP